MGITIQQIKDNERFEYKGDVVITENVGKNAIIVITDGNLTIKGNVGDLTKINLLSENSSVVINNSGKNNKLSVSNISGNKIFVNGNNVSVSNIGHLTINGSIGNHCSLKTHNGNINVKNAPNSVKLETVNGSVYVNGLQRQKPKKSKIKDTTRTYEGNLDITMVNGELYVNGKHVSEQSSNYQFSNKESTKTITLEPFGFLLNFFKYSTLGLAVGMTLKILENCSKWEKQQKHEQIPETFIGRYGMFKDSLSRGLQNLANGKVKIENKEYQVIFK